MCIYTHAHAHSLSILFHFSSLRLFSTFPISSLAVCLKPAWRAGVGGDVLTWHWVCSARLSVAAGGPFGFFWGQGLIVDCTPPAKMLIWNTNLELTSEEGEAGVRGRFTTASTAIHSSLLWGSLSLFFFLLPCRFPSLLIPRCIHKHTQTQGKHPGKRPKNTRITRGFTHTKSRNSQRFEWYSPFLRLSFY